MFSRLKIIWSRFWMRFADMPVVGPTATRLALIPVAPFRNRYPLATYFAHGFTAPDASIRKSDLTRGDYVYIGSHLTVFRTRDGGEVILGDRVYLNDGIRLETGQGGSIRIEEGTHVQADCQFSAYMGSIRVGKNVQIAPHCAFYPYNHGIAADRSMMEQPLSSRGDIEIQDDAWLGYGVIVLEDVTIGKGAVVGAGSVVKDHVPAMAICAGVPARVIGRRT
jgi:acetyltransferase-like isoleucine patch superfamily enzyme